jgi:uncharacterized protein
MVTWDESKRLRNLKIHGLDFMGCELIFDGPVVAEEDNRLVYGEQRMNVMGVLAAGRVVHMTYTERGDGLHVISLRKATKGGTDLIETAHLNPSKVPWVVKNPRCRPGYSCGFRLPGYLLMNPIASIPIKSVPPKHEI